MISIAGNLHHADYRVTKDGRMMFESSWFQCVQEHNLHVGMDVLILFVLEGSGVVRMTVACDYAMCFSGR
jgi:hypothetical protein